MEIILSEENKRIVKWTVYLLRKKLGETASSKAIHDDMQNCGNLGIKIVSDIIIDASEFINCDHQKRIVTDLSELGIWICYKDTAYRDIFFYILDEICKNSDKIRKQIKPYVKQPDQWHVNNWIDSKEITKKEIEEGKIPKGSVSIAESVHVPKIQAERFRKLARK